LFFNVNLLIIKIRGRGLPRNEKVYLKTEIITNLTVVMLHIDGFIPKY